MNFAGLDCGEPLCCRSPDAVGNSTQFSGGVYGDYAECDTPPATIASMMAAIKALDPPVDFMFLTGDDPPHNVWRQSHEFNTGVSFNLSTWFANTLPGVPAFPVLGNHNGFPVNVFNTNTTEDQSWLYTPLSQLFVKLGWFAQDTADQFDNAGFYTVTMPGKPHLRVITINTNFFNSANLWTQLDNGDIGGMFAWLRTTLGAAKAANESCYILGHHPPLTMFNNYTDLFAEIVREYSDTILGSFWGHTHKDAFNLFQDSTGNESVSVAFTPSSVTPYGGANPSFRVYEADATTGKLLDFVQYRLDLRKQGLEHISQPKNVTWEIAYRASEEYGVASVAPSELRSAAMKMKTDGLLFGKYYSNYFSGFRNASEFSPQDQTDLVCNLLSSTQSEYTNCTGHNFCDPPSLATCVV